MSSEVRCSSRRVSKVLGLTGLAVAAGLTLGVASGEGELGPAALAVPEAQAFGVFGSEPTIADTAERVLPGVVNISSSREAQGGGMQGMGPFFNDPFFREFFGRGFGGGQTPQRREQSRGSGVLVSGDGVVLTNNHVVENADEIEVTLSDGREFQAEVVGTDPSSDLAVLRLQGEDLGGLQPLSFGDSTSLRLGEVVLAVGNPFGLEGTVTMGIVSAKGRANVGIVDYEDFIQTDAAINPGNSGGALVNKKGELVGINTAILSRSGGYQGIGFAIPSDMAREIMNSLLEDGRVARGWLGVRIQDLRPDLARAFHTELRDGALIAEVLDGSPADKAGMLRGDIVIELDGRAIESSGDLRNRVGLARPGARVQLVVVRDGREKKIKLTLGELPTEGTEAAGKDLATGPLAGVQFGPLDSTNRKRFGVSGELRAGLVVVGLESGSPAARAGLKTGDVVLEVNRQAVGSVAELDKALSRESEGVLLLVAREGSTIYLLLRG